MPGSFVWTSKTMFELGNMMARMSSARLPSGLFDGCAADLDEPGRGVGVCAATGTSRTSMQATVKARTDSPQHAHAASSITTHPSPALGDVVSSALRLASVHNLWTMIWRR